MLDFIYKFARQHHSLFETAYAPFQLRYKPHLILDGVDSFRHPFTGGVRLRKRTTAEQERSELMKNNVNRVTHEMSCKIKEEFPLMHSSHGRLEEQFAILCERFKRHHEEMERQTNWIDNYGLNLMTHYFSWLDSWRLTEPCLEVMEESWLGA